LKYHIGHHPHPYLLCNFDHRFGIQRPTIWTLKSAINNTQLIFTSAEVQPFRAIVVVWFLEYLTTVFHRLRQMRWEDSYEWWVDGYWKETVASCFMVGNHGQNKNANETLHWGNRKFDWDATWVHDNSKFCLFVCFYHVPLITPCLKLTTRLYTIP
jgi:hypothetical protein